MQHQAGEAAVADGGPPLNVLVAEDNEINQRVIMGMLKNMGHRSAVVGDGTPRRSTPNASRIGLSSRSMKTW